MINRRDVLATFGTGDTRDAVQEDWLGVPMFFASFAPPANLEMVAAAGLEVVADDVEEIVEPGEGAARFQWVLARKPEA